MIPHRPVVAGQPLTDQFQFVMPGPGMTIEPGIPQSPEKNACLRAGPDAGPGKVVSVEQRLDELPLLQVLAQ